MFAPKFERNQEKIFTKFGDDDDEYEKNLRELSQPQERFAPKFKRNKSRYYSVQLGYLTLFETLMLKYP